MNLHQLPFTIPICSILCAILLLPLITGHNPQDAIAVNCGSAGNSTAFDGRRWVGEFHSTNIIFHGPDSKSVSSVNGDRSLSPDPIPYKTARVSRSAFSYTFHVDSGQKFIRLHFYPASYQGFKRTKGFFTVKWGSYTLLSNFSAFLAADLLDTKSIVKEFSVNVRKDQPLTITFSPSITSASDEVYAFVNGIEVVPMMAGLYYTMERDSWAYVVGQHYRLPIRTTTAMEMVYRLNIGGSSVLPAKDTGMFRQWSEDSSYLLESNISPITTTIRIKYSKISTNTAPLKVYQTSWSKKSNKQDNMEFNFTWRLPVDLGFRYLVRLHFCELDYEVKERGQREFSILINNEVVEANADLIEWSGDIGTAVYRDFMVMMEGDRMEGKQDLLIALSPHQNRVHWQISESIDAILKGLEVFKLSNHDNNLAGVNPTFSSIHAPVITNHDLSKLMSAPRGTNAIVTFVVISITLLNVIVYQLRIWGEQAGDKNVSLSLPVGMCRHFSLAEIQSATNNFNDELVVGRGGFGKVYKGLIDNNARTVAIKRLHSNSRQGEVGFWAEIQMLSQLRHPHLVTLIGFCDEGDEKILVYEYMTRGNLADHLYGSLADHQHKISHDDGGGNISSLSWEQRIKICLAAARALHYLHTNAEQIVIHQNVKSKRIMLDWNWVTKIAGSEFCKVATMSGACTYISTVVKGTFGYLDPEYFLTQRLTQKSDVYAFGVVLWEVLCGRPAIDMRAEGDQRSLAQWARIHFEAGTIHDIIDPSLRRQILADGLEVFSRIAYQCSNNRPHGRPSMALVLADLESVLAALGQGEEVTAHVTSVVAPEIEQIEEEKESTSPPSSSSSSSSSPPLQFDDKDMGQKKKPIGVTIGTLFQRSFQVLAHGLDILWKKNSSAESQMLELDPLLEEALQPLRRFSQAEIRDATDKFRDVIGTGGFSKVYKGQIDDGTPVAIKTLTSQEPQAIKNEVQMLSQIYHLNIISLIGYCKEEGMVALVLEHMANGSLHDHLHDNNPLPWIKRLEICIGAARGLQYLHSGTEQRIIHRDVKPANILLDEDWVAKVSDFGVSTVLPDERSRVTTRICGSRGYIDPEYYTTVWLTDKSDVYSFGVVLLEVLCARKPFDFPEEEGDRGYVVSYFRTSVRRNRIDKIIDPYLLGGIAPDCLMQFVDIALSCVADRGAERPSMDGVVAGLQTALQMQEDWQLDAED